VAVVKMEAVLDCALSEVIPIVVEKNERDLFKNRAG